MLAVRGVDAQWLGCAKAGLQSDEAHQEDRAEIWSTAEDHRYVQKEGPLPPQDDEPRAGEHALCRSVHR